MGSVVAVVLVLYAFDGIRLHFTQIAITTKLYQINSNVAFSLNPDFPLSLCLCATVLFLYFYLSFDALTGHEFSRMDDLLFLFLIDITLCVHHLCY